MKKDDLGRRKFVKLSTMGMGSLALASVPGASQADPQIHGDQKTPARQLRVLCVGAHPGDPEFGCGGTLAKYSDLGHLVTILYLTRGEAGDPTKTFEESAALRTKEAQTSCAILKASPMFAGQIDGHTELNKVSNGTMTQMILSTKPDIVFTHWPLDSHVDHQIAGLLTLTAWISSGRQFHLYFYEVNTGSETMGFEPTDYVDITDVRERKKTALLAHQTQNPQEVYDDYFKAMEDFRGLEVSKKAAEGFIHFKTNMDRSSIVGL
jgi:LmbE family N-acetylglucosaminyl deacetylase